MGLKSMKNILDDCPHHCSNHDKRQRMNNLLCFIIFDNPSYHEPKVTPKYTEANPKMLLEHKGLPLAF